MNPFLCSPERQLACRVTGRRLPDVPNERLGSKIPFPPGRPSVAERYSTRDQYAAAARAAAERLVAERFLLPGDVDAAVDAAVAGYRD